MIERVLVQNFQAHEKLDLCLDPEITTIMGPSDTGKSALLRAVKWLCLNRPRGDGFIRVGSTGMSVKAKIDGVVVKRERGTSSNSYALGKKEFKAFGNDVPSDIVDFVRLSDVNFQGQHDSQFWLSLSAPELARQLNKIVDLESIDKVTSALAQRSRALQESVRVIEKRLASATEKRDGLAYVEEASSDLDELEKDSAEIVELRDRIDSLRSTISQIDSARGKITRLQNCSTVGEKVVIHGEVVRELSVKVHNLRALLGLIDKASGVADQNVPGLSLLESLGGRVKKCAKKRDELSALMVQLREATKMVRVSMDGLQTARETYNRETDGQNCPICGTVLSNPTSTDSVLSRMRACDD